VAVVAHKPSAASERAVPGRTGWRTARAAAAAAAASASASDVCCLLCVQYASEAGVEGRPMLVLDGVLCTRGRSSVASPAVSVSGAWTGHLSRSEGACELSTAACALAVVRRRWSLTLGEQGQSLQTRPLGRMGGRGEGGGVRTGAARDSVRCGA
jgi:hypothetical protein